MQNNHELNEHKKSDAVKWVVVFTLITVLLAGTIAALAIAVNSAKTAETAALNDNLQVVSQQSNGVKLSMARLAENQYNTVTITATVSPEDVENKAVDWTIEWQTPDSEYASGKTVTDYCTLTPTSDGALTAKVQCLQPFEEYIDIKATTREGGYTAVCTIVFAGKPSGFTVSCAEVSPTGGYYNLGVGSMPRTYTFDLNLTNEWNSVGDKFYDFTVEVQGYGEFIVQDMQKDLYDAEYVRVGDERTIRAAEWPTTFMEVSISADKKLEIRPKKTVKNFGSEQVIAGGGRRITNAYKSGGDNVYFDVTVKTASGLSQTVKIKPVSAVSSISLNTYTHEF